MRFKQPRKTVQSSKTRKSIMICWFFASWGNTFLAQCTAEPGCFGRGEGAGAGAYGHAGAKVRGCEGSGCVWVRGCEGAGCVWARGELWARGVCGCASV